MTTTIPKLAFYPNIRKKDNYTRERTMVLMDTKQLCFIMGSLPTALPLLYDTFFIGSNLTLLVGFDGDMCHLDSTLYN